MTQPPPSGDPGNPWQTPPAALPPQPAPAAPVPATEAPPQFAAPPSLDAPPQFAAAPPQPEAPQQTWAPPGWPAPGTVPMSAPPLSAPPLSAPPYSAPPMSAPPGYPYPAFGPPLPPPRRRRGLWITLIIVAVLLVLGGGGGTAAYLLTRNPDGKGQATPQDAVDKFLQAVYVDQSPTKAAPFVCKAARDAQKLTAKVDEIKHQGQQYDNPKYAWVFVNTDHPTTSQAVVSTKITLTTDDVQSATETLKVTTIRSDGWFVCDIASA